MTVAEEDFTPEAAGDFSTQHTDDLRTSKAAQKKRAVETDDAQLITVQPIRKTDMQPKFAQELATEHLEYGFYGAFLHGMGEFFGFFGQIPCLFCCPNPYNEVPQGSVGMVTRFGQAIRTVDPGLARVNPCSERIIMQNVQIQTSKLPRQRLLTRDNVDIEIDSILYYHLSNPFRATFGVANVREALVERACTTMRQVVGARTLQSVISDREAVAAEIHDSLESISEKWGIKVESISIKDLIIDKATQELLSSAATQRRLGESKIIAAKAEVEAAKLMRSAADILASPAALQIRQLETMQAIAKTSNSKVIFVPMSNPSLFYDGAGAPAQPLNAPLPGGATSAQVQASIAQDNASGSGSGNGMREAIGIAQLASL